MQILSVLHNYFQNPLEFCWIYDVYIWKNSCSQKNISITRKSNCITDVFHVHSLIRLQWTKNKKSILLSLRIHLTVSASLSILLWAYVNDNEMKHAIHCFRSHILYMSAHANAHTRILNTIFYMWWYEKYFLTLCVLYFYLLRPNLCKRMCVSVFNFNFCMLVYIYICKWVAKYKSVVLIRSVIISHDSHTR